MDNESQSIIEDAVLGPKNGKWKVVVQTVVDAEDNAQHIVVLRIGNQSFDLDYEAECRSSAEWMAHMLEKAMLSVSSA